MCSVVALAIIGIAALEVWVSREKHLIAVIEAGGGSVQLQPLVPAVWYLRLGRILHGRYAPLYVAPRGVRFRTGAAGPALHRALESAASLRRVEWIDLSATGIVGEDLEPLAGTASLRVLNLRATAVGNAAIEDLWRILSLTTLILSKTEFAGPQWQRLLALPHLERLELDGTEIAINESFAAGLVAAPLRVLSLADTAIDGANLAALVSLLPDLVELDLSGTAIQDHELQAVRDQRQLLLPVTTVILAHCVASFVTQGGAVASRILLPRWQSKEARWQASVERHGWRSSAPWRSATRHRARATRRSSSMSSSG